MSKIKFPFRILANVALLKKKWVYFDSEVHEKRVTAGVRLNSKRRFIQLKFN